MTQTIKSVHIEGCWPFKYEAPVRRQSRSTEETRLRDNARKREQYWAKKQLLQLRVYELDIDICGELNHASAKSRK